MTTSTPGNGGPKPAGPPAGRRRTIVTATRTAGRPDTGPGDDRHRHDGNGGNGDYVVPVLHLTVPESTVNAGFWGALVGAAALGVIDLPLAALIGAGVLVARHRRSH